MKVSPSPGKMALFPATWQALGHDDASPDLTPQRTKREVRWKLQRGLDVPSWTCKETSRAEQRTRWQLGSPESLTQEASGALWNKSHSKGSFLEVRLLCINMYIIRLLAGSHHKRKHLWLEWTVQKHSSFKTPSERTKTTTLETHRQI